MSSDDLTPVDGFTGPSPARIAEALRRGPCPSDRAFDSFLPHDLRLASSEYWTPLVAAVQAARWLDELQVRSVVDIGAGPGKFCVAAALAGNCELVGLEHRPRFVAIARSLARQFGVEDRARFIKGSLHDASVPLADAYYLYNPFAENLFGPGGYLAPDVELSCERYSLDITTTQSLFRCAAKGTIVLTYNGFGGCMPASYEQVRVDRELPCVLRMWRKSQSGDDGAFAIADAD
ncbi:MAG: class I SAM-dependent methyltransferase [Deltaproteobacteria bacterium]